MKFKALFIGAAILASAVAGDYCNVKDRFIEPVRYKNVNVDQESYQKPFNLQKKYQTNEKGELEVYIGEEDEWYKVDKDLRVNERELSEMIKDEAKNLKPYIKDKIDELIDWYEGLKDGNHN